MKKNNHRQENAKRVLKAAGYAAGGAVVPEPRETVTTKNTGKIPEKVGATASGLKPAMRLDKMKRGGKAKSKGKTQVNINIGKGEDKPPMIPPGALAALGGAKPPMPMLPPPGLGAPPGAGPLPPMKKGGAVKMTAGAGGGEGRMQKAKAYGKKRGGKC